VHPKLGLAILIVSCMQLVLGVLRPGIGSVHRARWLTAHSTFGRLLVGAAWANCILGILLFHAKLAEPLAAWMVPSVLAMVSCRPLGPLGPLSRGGLLLAGAARSLPGACAALRPGFGPGPARASSAQQGVPRAPGHACSNDPDPARGGRGQSMRSRAFHPADPMLPTGRCWRAAGASGLLGDGCTPGANGIARTARCRALAPLPAVRRPSSWSPTA
jgi:hypothetical protein